MTTKQDYVDEQEEFINNEKEAQDVEIKERDSESNTVDTFQHNTSLEGGSQNENNSSQQETNSEGEPQNGSNLPVFSCDYCGNEEKTFEAMVKHYKSHEANNNSKMYHCDICYKVFSQAANMRRHRMRHTGIRPYECRVCSKRFFRKDHLDEHMFTHSRKCPQCCPICGKCFFRQAHLKLHMINDHPGASPRKICKLCGFRASTVQEAQLHATNEHRDGGTENGPKLEQRNSPIPTMEVPVDISHVLGPISQSLRTEALTITSSKGLDLSKEVSLTIVPDHIDKTASPINNSPTSSFIQPGQQFPSSLPYSLRSQAPSALIRQFNESRLSSTLSQISSGQQPLSPIEICLDEEDSASNTNLEKTVAEYNHSQQDIDSYQSSPLSISESVQEQELNQISLKCIFCGIIFPDQTLYFLHKGVHAENNPWKCNICGTKCSNKYDFNTHILSQPHK